MKLIIVLFSLFINLNIFAQSEITTTEEKQIISVINDYIIGTAYSYPEQLKSAFVPNANMFLDKDEQPLWVLTIEEYTKGVAKSEPGKFNGRVTNILSIDRFEEVIIPAIKRRFVDMLLLKKLEDGWKIISKTAAGVPSENQGKKAIIVASNVTQKENDEFSTGNSFSEIAVAYDEYQKAGYHVDIVSPEGGKIPIAYINPADSFHLASMYNSDFMYALSSSKKPSDINPDEYEIIQFTGGSAPIFDIPQNTAIQKLAMHIYEKNEGIIAAVCHGTAGIVNLKTADGKYLIEGKTINGYPDAHENKDLPLYKNFPFLIEKEVENRGGHFKYGEKGKAYMEVDGRLITGQNYQSSASSFNMVVYFFKNLRIR